MPSFIKKGVKVSANNSFKRLAVVIGCAGLLAGGMLGVGAKPAAAEQTGYTCSSPQACVAGNYVCVVVCGTKCTCTIG